MPAQAGTRREWLTTALGIALCLAVTGALLVLYFWLERRHAPVLLFALLVPALWAYPFTVRIRRLIAGRHFSRAELILDTHRPGLGQSVRVRLTLSARKTIKLAGCSLVLRTIETVRKPRHKSQTCESAPSTRSGRGGEHVESARVEVLIETPETLPREEPRVFEDEITVPADGMESFEGRNCSLGWVLEARALLGKTSALLDRQELVVRPIRSGDADASPDALTAGDRLRLTLRPGSLQVGSKGHIEVIVADALPVSGASLAVGVCWQARTADGRKSPEHSVFAETAIDLAAGQPIGFDFLVPPAGPMSYAGKLFEIAWTVRATLHSPDGAAIETTEFPVTIRPQSA